MVWFDLSGDGVADSDLLGIRRHTGSEPIVLSLLCEQECEPIVLGVNRNVRNVRAYCSRCEQEVT